MIQHVKRKLWACRHEITAAFTSALHSSVVQSATPFHCSSPANLHSLVTPSFCCWKISETNSQPNLNYCDELDAIAELYNYLITCTSLHFKFVGRII